MGRGPRTIHLTYGPRGLWALKINDHLIVRLLSLVYINRGFNKFYSWACQLARKTFLKNRSGMYYTGGVETIIDMSNNYIRDANVCLT